jgi:hypothetical protein
MLDDIIQTGLTFDDVLLFSDRRVLEVNISISCNVQIISLSFAATCYRYRSRPCDSHCARAAPGMIPGDESRDKNK